MGFFSSLGDALGDLASGIGSAVNDAWQKQVKDQMTRFRGRSQSDLVSVINNENANGIYKVAAFLVLKKEHYLREDSIHDLFEGSDDDWDTLTRQAGRFVG